MNTRFFLFIILVSAVARVLHACGGLEVGIEATPTPLAMQHLMLGPIDFGCQCDAIDHIAGRGIGASIHLPDGVLVTQITVMYRVQNAESDGAALVLQRQRGDQLETIAAGTLAQRQDTGNHTDVLAIPASPLALIDTTQYTYRLILQDPQPFSVKRMPIAIQQVRLDYLPASAVPPMTPIGMTPITATDMFLTPSPILLGMTTLTPSPQFTPTQEPTEAAATQQAYQTIIAVWTPTPRGTGPAYPPPLPTSAPGTVTPTVTATNVTSTPDTTSTPEPDVFPTLTPIALTAVTFTFAEPTPTTTPLP